MTGAAVSKGSVFSITAIDPELVARNAEAVAAFAGEVSDTPRTNYFKALNTIQSRAFGFSADTDDLICDFGHGDDSELELFRILMLTDDSRADDWSFPDQWRYDEAQEVRYRSLVDDGLALLRRLSPTTVAALRATVARLCFARQAHFGGGSVSDLLGVIWLGPSDDWSEIDFADVLLHEFVHQSLFLDEMVNTIFSTHVPRMAEDDALVTSSLLKKPRGYDRAYHSAFVAFTQAEFYVALGDLERARASISGVRQTLEELLARRQFCTDRGIEHLDELLAIAGPLESKLNA